MVGVVLIISIFTAIGGGIGGAISWFVKPVPLPPPPPTIWPLLTAAAAIASVLTWIFMTNRPSPLRHDQPARHFQELPPPHDPTCPICIEGINTIILPCGHSFHIDCIRNWFVHEINIEGRTMNCPTCRYNISRHMENEYRQRLNIN